MSHLVKLIINGGILLFLSLNNAAFAENINLKGLSKSIESALNNNDLSNVNGLLETEIAVSIKEDFLDFQKEFPNAKWEINPAGTLKDNRKLIKLAVTALKKKDSQLYTLETNQRIALEIKKGKITSHEIISEESILKNTNKPIDITLQIPNTALTGSRYDVDIIINQPLENSIVAGNLISLNHKKNINQSLEKIELMPMGSGGIFKSVQAPMEPGYQKWAAIIVHPEGLISITKFVKIVSNENDLNL